MRLPKAKQYKKIERHAAAENFNRWSKKFDDRLHRMGGFFMRKS